MYCHVIFMVCKTRVWQHVYSLLGCSRKQHGYSWKLRSCIQYPLTVSSKPLKNQTIFQLLGSWLIFSIRLVQPFTNTQTFFCSTNKRKWVSPHTGEKLMIYIRVLFNNILKFASMLCYYFCDCPVPSNVTTDWFSNMTFLDFHLKMH